MGETAIRTVCQGPKERHVVWAQGVATDSWKRLPVNSSLTIWP